MVVVVVGVDERARFGEETPTTLRSGHQSEKNEDTPGVLGVAVMRVSLAG